MCRIAGIISTNPSGDRERCVAAMVTSMAHGGPDDEGIQSAGKVTLGHRRLSIIDLSSAGHQPMIDEGIVLSYNGEIYNYKQLRAELLRQGRNFRTATDTEVIAEAYRHWGPSAFDRLAGMFAFALHDIARGKVFLVRDANGIKPLYYFADDGIVFASEVKAFKAYRNSWPEDKNWKQLFLTFGFLPHPFTSLQGVKSLSPGTYLEIDLSTIATREVRFGDAGMDERESNEPKSTSQRVREAMVEATRRHLISDAPLGVFLSGGIDSSLLTLLASRELGDQLRTVSVNFREAALDETAYQKQVLTRAGGQHQHQSFVVSEEMFWAAWPDIWQYMDQPSIDGVNSYFVSRSAHNSGLKAVLSGLGADELFGGYASFRRISLIKSLRGLPAKKGIARLMGQKKDAFRRLVFLEIPGPFGDYLFLRGIHTPDVVARILQCREAEVWNLLFSLSIQAPAGLDDLAYASFLESNIYMRNQLLKDTDYMSMRYGLEVRVPFLDRDLVRTVHSIGLAGNFKPSHPKYLLTHTFSDVLPLEIVHRKKQGFVFPFHLWLANGLKSGRPVISEKLKGPLGVDNFLAGSSHWSKCWSGAVLENFKA